MDTVVGPNQVGHAVHRVHVTISGAWSWFPTFRCWVRVRMELSNDHTILEGGWVAEVNVRLAAWRRALHADLAGAQVLINPAAFLMPPGRIVRL